MRFLLDTHALLWWLSDDARLSPVARRTIATGDNEIFVSAASAWEISTKFTKGRLPNAAALLPNFSQAIHEIGFIDLPITSAHMVRSVLLDGAHKDPFDRILAAQSILEGMALISLDRKMEPLGVMTLW